jgi:antitoxin PrlF
MFSILDIKDSCFFVLVNSVILCYHSITMNISISSLREHVMKELETSLTQKGQVTIPAEIRAKLGLKPKDLVRFELEGDAVKLKPAPSQLLAGFGAATPRQKPENYRKIREDMEAAMAEEVVTEDP